MILEEGPLAKPPDPARGRGAVRSRAPHFARVDNVVGTHRARTRRWGAVRRDRDRGVAAERPAMALIARGCAPGARLGLGAVHVRRDHQRQPLRSRQARFGAAAAARGAGRSGASGTWRGRARRCATRIQRRLPRLPTCPTGLSRSDGRLPAAGPQRDRTAWPLSRDRRHFPERTRTLGRSCEGGHGRADAQSFRRCASRDRSAHRPADSRALLDHRGDVEGRRYRRAGDLVIDVDRFK